MKTGEKGRGMAEVLGGRELFFIALALVLPLEYSLSFLERELLTGAFLALAGAFLVAVLVLVIAVLWRRRFGCESLGRVYIDCFGAFGGRICLGLCVLSYAVALLVLAFSAAYLWQQLTNGSLLLLETGLLLVAFLVGRQTLVTVGRLATFVIFLDLLILLIVLGFGLVSGDGALVPRLELPDPSELGFGIASAFGSSFGLLAAWFWFLLAAPKTDGLRKKDRSAQSLIGAVIVACGLIFLLILRNLSNLGAAVAFFPAPVVELMKTVVRGRGFGHPEIWGGMVILSWALLAMLIMAAVLLRSCESIYPSRSKSSLAFAWFLLFFVVFWLWRPGILEIGFIRRYILPASGLVSAVILPGLALLFHRRKQKTKMYT